MYLFKFSHQQISQSSDFVRKVKEKLTKQLPGSNIDSCFQSDSEIEQMFANANPLQSMHTQKSLNNSMHLQKFTNCPTPDSIFSTGSASIYSNLIGRSNSSAFMMPEKLQIVKPLEGSQTLQQWQKLGTPNLACLFEARPGISIKGNSPDEATLQNKRPLNKKYAHDSNLYLDEDDGVNLDMYDDDADEDDFDFNFFNNKTTLNHQADSDSNENANTNYPNKYALSYLKIMKTQIICQESQRTDLLLFY